MAPSDVQMMAGGPQMAQEHGPELRLLPGQEQPDAVADKIDGNTSQPELQAETDGRGQGTERDGHAPRDAAQQDRFGQGAMQRHRPAREFFGARHATSAPPAKLKKVRKNEAAAK